MVKEHKTSQAAFEDRIRDYRLSPNLIEGDLAFAVGVLLGSGCPSAAAAVAVAHERMFPYADPLYVTPPRDS
jgi:hypothetical protein